MKAGSVTGVSVCTELLHVIDELSTELVRDRRNRERSEAARALKLGLDEAQHMRDAAGKARTGAIVGGALTAVGGITQIAGACSTQTDPDFSKVDPKLPKECQLKISVESMRAVNTRASDIGQFGGSVVQSGSLASGAFESSSKFDEADAREAAARAEAAGRNADSDRSAAELDQQTQQKAREAFARSIELEHASRMAVLRG
jgi:hypothetical protein